MSFSSVGRRIAADLLPPIVRRILRPDHRSLRPSTSYEAAMAAIGTQGYNQEMLASMIIGKNLAAAERLDDPHRNLTIHDMRALTALSMLAPEGGQIRTVLDFGGGGGHHYFVARALRQEKLDWRVVETAALCNAAKRVKVEGLSFHATIARAAANCQQIDMVFSSGALPYTPDPLAFTRELLDLRARCVFLTRIALNEPGHGTKVGVQRSRLAENGPGRLPPGYKDDQVEVPITLVDRAAFEAVLAERHGIEACIDEGDSGHKLNGTTIRLYGYLLRPHA